MRDLLGFRAIGGRPVVAFWKDEFLPLFRDMAGNEFLRDVLKLFRRRLERLMRNCHASALERFIFFEIVAAQAR